MSDPAGMILPLAHRGWPKRNQGNEAGSSISTPLGRAALGIFVGIRFID